MTTPKYGTGEHSENQVNGEVTANSAYRRIESLATLEVLDRDLTRSDIGYTGGPSSPPPLPD